MDKEGSDKTTLRKVSLAVGGGRKRHRRARAHRRRTARGGPHPKPAPGIAGGGDAGEGDATNGAPGDRVIRLRLDTRFPTRRVLAERRGFRRLARTESSAWLDLADYRSELKLYLRSGDGRIAAFVGLWYDEANRWGIVEPAGTVGEHRRRGLGTALLAEGARRVAELGGRGIRVGSDQAFYLACGFRIVNMQGIWEKRYPALSEGAAEPNFTSRS